MSTLTIYVNGLKHDVDIPSSPYEPADVADDINTYFKSRNIPIEVEFDVTADVPDIWSIDGGIPPVNGGSYEGGGDVDYLSSFTFKRTTDVPGIVNNAAVYDRGIVDENPWDYGSDINSFLAGSRFVDFNNLKKDRDAYPYPPDWLAVGEFETEYDVTEIDVTNLSALQDIIESIIVGTDKSYEVDPRISAKVIKFVTSKQSPIQISLYIPPPSRLLSRTTYEYNGDNCLVSGEGGTYRTASPYDKASTGSNDSDFFIQSGQVIWVLITDRVINSVFLPTNRDTEVPLTISRLTIFKKSSRINALYNSDNQGLAIELSAWSSAVKIFDWNYSSVTHAIWANVQPMPQEREYEFTFQNYLIDENELFYFLSDQSNLLMNDDDDLELLPLNAAWNPTLSAFSFRVTIPANKALVMYIKGKGYNTNLYGYIVP